MKRFGTRILLCALAALCASAISCVGPTTPQTTSHKISFDANGGSGTMASQSIDEGASAALSVNAFTRTGYAFAGWAETKDAASAKYADKADYTMGMADLTLYAVWGLPAMTISVLCGDSYAGMHSITSDGTWIYAAQADAARVRRVKIADGTIEDFAGGKGYYVDGTGSAAGFRLPVGILYVDSSFYVSDCYGSSIRKIDIDATGAAVVSTIAGTYGKQGTTDAQGSDARFQTPAGLASDGSTLYIGDTGNSNIRTLNLATKEVGTLKDPSGTAISINSNRLALVGRKLYVTCSGSPCIKVVDLDNGNAVSVFTGVEGTKGLADGPAGQALFSSPFGIVHDNGFLYVADAGNNKIRRIDLATGMVVSLAPTGGASMNSPYGICVVDSAIYISDSGDNQILCIK